MAFTSVSVAVFLAVLAVSVAGQSARDTHGPSPLIAIDDEPPPKLIVDPPLAEALAQGRVFIQYRTEHLRVFWSGWSLVRIECCSNWRIRRTG